MNYVCTEEDEEQKKKKDDWKRFFFVSVVVTGRTSEKKKLALNEESKATDRPVRVVGPSTISLQNLIKTQPQQQQNAYCDGINSIRERGGNGKEEKKIKKKNLSFDHSWNFIIWETGEILACENVSLVCVLKEEGSVGSVR